MREIKLRNGMIAFVDDEDYEAVNAIKWYLHNGYARSKSPGQKDIFMHNFIMGIKGIDHIDMNRLNNTRANLRKCSNSSNNMNKKLTKSNTSGIKGVRFHRWSGKWIAEVKKDWKVQFCKTFDTADEAAHAYNKAAIALHGEFAVLNPIGEDKNPLSLLRPQPQADESGLPG